MNNNSGIITLLNFPKRNSLPFPIFSSTECPYPRVLPFYLDRTASGHRMFPRGKEKFQPTGWKGS